jgi:hypothetical protein
MGVRDSSATRVFPVFSQLHTLDPTGRSWLARLLTLPEISGRRRDEPSLGEIEQCAWWPHERLVEPPGSLLEHLRNNRPADFAGADASSYVFEYRTHIDAYLETDEAIIVVEGKRTEAGPTTSTKWMPVRHQMLRNIDVVWDNRRRKSVYGFFIVEGEDSDAIPAKWIQFAEDTIAPDALNASLPHRHENERAAMRAAFLGVTTWQSVCTTLGIRFDLLPHEIVLMRNAPN